jgi:transcription factor C subunit 3
VAIRTLTGGLEQHIDWVLIAKAFEGTHEQMFLHSRWANIREKNKLLMPNLEKDFQTMFPKAYEEGKIPSIDFENLAAYNWKALIDWTLDSLGTDLQSRPELPADRYKFDDTYTLDEAPEEDISGFYEIDAPSNTAKRTSIVNRGAYQYPSNLGTNLAPPEDREQIATAKTWVRANIITPEDTYDGVAARNKLSTFPVRVIEDALKELLIDRVLMQENKGRLIPGRNYDVSEYLISRLKKNLLPAHFKRALAYKKQLDLDFEETGSALYSLTADDGDVLAIINMVAEKRITLTPISIPAKKWGLTDGSYETRQMDKKHLNFDIELRPLPAYMEGIPLSPFPPPPSHHLRNPDAKIPLWYDIHGHLVPVMWEMALAAILAVLAIRSGIGAMELERAVRPAMDVWEIELVLEWSVAARAARKVGRGFAVCEWWWLALGSLEEVKSGFGEGLGRENGKGRA